jgi:SAM-dependent methyltransferase
MSDQNDPLMTEAWEKRWQDADPRRCISPLGRWMFRSKRKALRETLAAISFERAIDVGCGLGHTLELVQKTGAQAVGIDISANAVRHCAAKGLSVFRQSLEDVDEVFDLVLSDGLLEHLLHFEPYARHMMRISGRYVLLIQPNHDSLPGKTLAFLAGIFQNRRNVHEYNYRIADFVAAFDRRGFRLKKNRPIFFDVFRLLLFDKSPVS